MLADIFRKQIGSTLEEGNVDSDSEEEFWLRLSQLKEVWTTRLGNVGTNLHSWA